MKAMGVLVKSTAQEQDFDAFWDRFMERAKELAGEGRVKAAGYVAHD